MDRVFINPGLHKVAYAVPARTQERGPLPATAYPNYSAAERMADALIHMTGIGCACGAAYALTTLTAITGSVTDMIAVWLYCIVMLAAFSASAIYHMTPWEHMRPTFRRFDHAAIFLKIAGTYTPLVVLIGSNFSFLVLGAVWATALFGVIRRLFYWSEPGMGSTLLYMGLGWASLALVWPMIQTIPAISFWLVLTGGITYTIGIIFYKWESLKYSNAIWHGFVLAASGCFFIAIFLGELAKQGQLPG